jgi:hypothetical protein
LRFNDDEAKQVTRIISAADENEDEEEEDEEDAEVEEEDAEEDAEDPEEDFVNCKDEIFNISIIELRFCRVTSSK